VITLNWFKKTQTNENETLEKESTQNIETKQVDSEHSQNEQNLPESEIKTQTQHLKSISKKLADVKKEYDTAIENLISIKKELIQEKKDMASLNTMSSISHVSSSQLDKKIIESEKIKQEKDILENTQAKIKKGQKELEVIKKLSNESVKDMEQAKREQCTTESRLKTLVLQIKKSQEELENIEEKKQKIVDEIKVAKNTNPTNKKSSDESQEAKHLVEAASEVIASMKNKVNIAEKEIKTVEGLLQKERNEHQVTKKQLESLKKLTETKS